MSNKIKSSNSKKNRAQASQSEAYKEIIEYILAAFIIVLFVTLPLYLKDGFSDVGTMKYDAYKLVAGIGLGLTALIALAYGINKRFKFEYKFSYTDYCCATFLVVCLLGAAISGNFTDCIMGYPGWFMGIVSQFSFVLIFFFVSRFGRFDKAIIYVFLGVLIFVFGVGVLNKLMIDPLGTYYLGTEYELSTYNKNNFLSTMGQVSWYSSFVATALPLALGVFWYSEGKNTRIYSGIVSMIGFLTLTSQNSDSAYMALAGFMMVFFWFSVKDVHRMERFWELVFMFALSTRLMNLLLLIHPNDELELDSLSNFMINNSLMWLIVIISGGIWAAFYFVFEKKKIYNVKLWTILRYVALGALSLVILVATVIILLSATENTPAWLAELTAGNSYLNWSDDWGNHRGMSWTANVIMFRDMDVLNKIFGVGPDGYAFYAYNTGLEEILNQMFPGLVLCNAHNEWMNALISYGIIGATAYIGIFVTCIKNFARFNEKNPLYVAYIACVVSYMAHNFFCYQQVCCTPFLFVLMGYGTYLYRKDSSELAVKEKIQQNKTKKSAGSESIDTKEDKKKNKKY